MVVLGLFIVHCLSLLMTFFSKFSYFCLVRVSCHVSPMGFDFHFSCKFSIERLEGGGIWIPLRSHRLLSP